MQITLMCHLIIYLDEQRIPKENFMIVISNLALYKRICVSS